MASPNYFVCTLGQAIDWRSKKQQHQESCDNVLQLLDLLAVRNPDSLAVGFADSPLTFKELKTASVSSAAILSARVAREPRNVALLSFSSIDFILTWLGLMRLGHTALFLAPQLEPAAIQHLCNSLSVDTVFHDEAHAGKVSDLHQISALPVATHDAVHDSPSKDTAANLKSNKVSDIAYYCHTSGTSSGLPKPIPQPQHGAVAALPPFIGPSDCATFTTTPLYHGGLPDALRAWTSGAAIWFFSESKLPITSDNVVAAISLARHKCDVKYFSSVPYILQMLAESQAGLSVLKTMDLVGVGGAALPPSVGDGLVASGVNLVSRMGSAECGFLLSSHRDYASDKEWQYLRHSPSGLLQFVPRDDDLCELVVTPEWPLRVKTTSPDGSYATNDLFAAHPTVPNAWRYHSRADAQITLANGKKFDPSPVEGAVLAASSSVVRDVLVFGTGRHYPGILLFPSGGKPEDIVIEAVWHILGAMNASTQTHARIAKFMLVYVPPDGDAPLEKSSKGTILRRQAEQRYASYIDAAYTTDAKSRTTFSSVADLQQHIKDCASQVLSKSLDFEGDLYGQGVDSIACIQIRNKLETTVQLPLPLPFNILYDKSSLHGLSQYLWDLQQGTCNTDNHDSSTSLMRKMVEEYSLPVIKPDEKRQNLHREKVVVLTGATGFLGCHILSQLMQDTSVAKVYCLVRASPEASASDRVLGKLTSYGLQSEIHTARVICLASDITKPNLNLSASTLERISSEATMFIHSAWPVNFTLRLGSFTSQFEALQNLLTVAIRSDSHLVFISSTASVVQAASPISEQVTDDPKVASSLGYSQSKWVAEQVCHHAAVTSGARVTVIRVGQLCGNQHGIWNPSEAFPLLLSTARFTGCLPDLPESLDWLPVEEAAASVLEIATADQSSNHDQVYHVLNTSPEPSWRAMLDWLRESDKDSFEIVSPQTWLTKLEEGLRNKDNIKHPSEPLLGLWRWAYTENSGGSHTSTFATEETMRVSETMNKVRPLDRDRLVVIWEWVRRNV